MAIATKQLSTHQKTCYDHDFYAWTQEQSHLLRTEQLQLIDIQNLAEDMGRAEKHELESRLEILLMHLLKWQFQPSHRSRSWQLAIKEQRLWFCKDISSKVLALRQLFLAFVRGCIS